MSAIQKARDVLAKWADGTTPRPWAIEEIPETGECRIFMVDEDLDAPTIVTVTSGGMTRADAALIVGTAGNPGLLDAIDALMADELIDSGVCHCGTDRATHGLEEHAFVDMGVPPNPFVEAIAAAIVAADERMRS